MENSYWYEIHITVELLPLGKSFFEKVCKFIKVKPIVINLEKSPGCIIQQDVMTSSKYFGTYELVYSYAISIKKNLEEYGFKILRIKIESEPQHEKSPKQVGDSMPPGGYFESHIAFLIEKSQREQLQVIAQEGGARVSHNPFKIIDQKMVVMMTLRDYESPFILFDEKLQKLIRNAKNNNFIPYKKIEVEFAVYDSNNNHDGSWIN